MNSQVILTASLLPAVLLLASANAAAGFGGSGSYSTRAIHEARKLYRIDVNYPVFSGISKAAEVNSGVLQFSKGQIKEFKNGTSSSEKSTFIGTFKVAAASSEIVSVRFTFENCCPPSGRPAETIVEFNYSPQLGEQLSLADIFRESVKYEDLLSAIGLDELIDKEEVQSCELATEPDKDNFDDFSLSDSGIDLHFGSSVESDYSAAVMNYHRVHIPWRRIRSIVSPDSPAYSTAHAFRAPGNIKEITKDNFDSVVAETFIEAYSKAISRFPKDPYGYRKRASWRNKIGQVALAAADTKRADDLEAAERQARIASSNPEASTMPSPSTQSDAEQPAPGKGAVGIRQAGWAIAVLGGFIFLVLLVVCVLRRDAHGKK